MAQHMWDWSSLNSSLPRSIRLSDLDGIVEIGGHFLVIESKSANGALSTGQRIALERLSWLPEMTVIVLQGPDGMRSVNQIQVCKNGAFGLAQSITHDEVAARVKRWADRHAGVYPKYQHRRGAAA